MLEGGLKKDSDVKEIRLHLPGTERGPVLEGVPPDPAASPMASADGLLQVPQL